MLAKMLAMNKKGISRKRQLLVIIGAGTGGRTPDLLITNQGKAGFRPFFAFPDNFVSPEKSLDIPVNCL